MIPKTRVQEEVFVFLKNYPSPPKFTSNTYKELQRHHLKSRRLRNEMCRKMIRSRRLTPLRTRSQNFYSGEYHGALLVLGAAQDGDARAGSSETPLFIFHPNRPSDHAGSGLGDPGKMKRSPVSTTLMNAFVLFLDSLLCGRIESTLQRSEN